MHIPDGFVSGPVNLAGYAIAAGAVAVSLRNLHKTLPEDRMPVLGVTAAFVFAAQMINFPIGAGTSGHFLGALMSAVLLGPWAACIVMTLVLAVQCLLFADGGLTALGVNIFNMGIVGGMAAYCLFLFLRGLFPRNMRGFYFALAVSAWFSIVAASITAAIELGVSGTFPMRVAIPAMGGVHAVIGIGEAFITVATMSVVHAARPDLMHRAITDTPALSRRRWTVIALAAALVLAVGVSHFASSAPDGLEKVAEDHQFLNKALDTPAWPWPLIADYGQTPAATAVAGFVGTLAVFSAGIALLKMSRRAKQSKQRPVDARVKLLALVIAMIGCVTTPQSAYAAFAAYIACILALAVATRVPPRVMIRNTLAIMPLILMCGLFAVIRGDWPLLWSVTAKSVFGILAVTVFAAATHLPQLLAALEQMRMPRILVMMAAFMYRYLGLFIDEVRRMKRARDSRGGGGRWLWQAGRMGHVAGAMFLRSYERGERVYLNLLSRGYRGRFYYRRAESLRWTDYAVLAATIAVFIIIRNVAA